MTLDHDLRQHIRVERDRRQRHRGGSGARVCDLRLLIALGKLTELQREAWIDRNVLGHSTETIAARMGISVHAVRQYDRRATIRLAALVGPAFIEQWAPMQDAA